MKKSLTVLAILFALVCIIGCAKNPNGGSSGSFDSYQKGIAAFEYKADMGDIKIRDLLIFYEDKTYIFEETFSDAYDSDKMKIDGTYTGDPTKDGTVELKVITQQGYPFISTEGEIKYNLGTASIKDNDCSFELALKEDNHYASIGYTLYKIY